MPKAALYDMEGKVQREVELAENVFGVKLARGPLHLAVLRQLSNARRGTACTKTRGEVSGGGKKPWKQKGTGRARHGSSRSPIWKGGGTVFGPQPRDYSFPMPRKMRRLALRSALSARVSDNSVTLISKLSFEKPSTKGFIELLSNLKLENKVLLIVKELEENVEKSARNIPRVRMITAGNLNVHDILNCDHLLIEQDALASMEEVLA